MKNDLQEFEEFKESEGPLPPSSFTQAIFAHVNRDLSPLAWQVFAKLSLIHFFVAAVMLTICPQFGIRLFGEGLGLMGYFMRLGDYGCPIACGAFFMGSSLVVATFLITIEEVRVLKQNQLLEFGALALLSLGAFIMLHAEVVVGFALSWILGTVLGGSISFELSRFVRVKFLRLSQAP
jgi:hypothetical protein